MRLLTLVVALLISLPGLTAGAADTRKHVKTSALADLKTVRPGESFNVGVLLRIDADWHVYWENPGESGVPTRVAITAPPGVNVEPVRYPLPKEFVQPGDVKGYGYEGEVMLIARVTVPKDWPKGKSIDLSADVSWLHCKDVCVPGKSKLYVSVDAGDVNEADNTETFAKWQPQLPMDAKDPGVPFTVEGSATDLKLHWSKPGKDVKVLAIPPGGVDVPSVAVEQFDKATRIKPTLRLLGGEKKPGAALGFLVTYDDENGHRRGVRLSIPLQTPGQ